MSVYGSWKVLWPKTLCIKHVPVVGSCVDSPVSVPLCHKCLSLSDNLISFPCHCVLSMIITLWPLSAGFPLPRCPVSSSEVHCVYYVFMIHTYNSRNLDTTDVRVVCSVMDECDYSFVLCVVNCKHFDFADQLPAIFLLKNNRQAN